MNPLHPIRPQLHPRRKELNPLILIQRTLHKRWFHHPLRPLRRLQQTLREPRPRHGHRQRRGPGAVLRFHDFVAAELDAVDVIVEVFAGEGVAGLGEEGDDGGAGVAADDDDVFVRRVGLFVLGDEAGGADDVEGGDAE